MVVKQHFNKLVLGRRERDHAVPLLRSLCWSPVRAGPTAYRIFILCYRSLVPAHFRVCLILSLPISLPALCVSSSDAGLLTASRLKLSKCGKLVECCFTSTETVGLLGTGAQDSHLDFHTAPELCVWKGVS